MKQILVKIFFLILIFFTPTFFAFAATPLKILIVPGHDNSVWGAQYGNLKEADMNLFLATEIADLLKKDKKFEVHITRDSSGYTKEFSDYFAQNQSEILSFVDNAKKQMQTEVAKGQFVTKENAPHHAVSEDVALRLYEINKWANENNIDAVIHIHFNDYPRPTKWAKGKYKGFVIYIPDNQFANFKGSMDLAGSIFSQLHKKYITSTYDNEKGGLITDQKLIALGANNTLTKNVNSVLVEYGYIYRFGNSTMRHKAYNIMTNLTVTGIKSFFKGKKLSAS